MRYSAPTRPLWHCSNIRVYKIRKADEEEAKLIRLYMNKVNIEDIMKELGRNHGAVIARLKKLGFIKSKKRIII